VSKPETVNTETFSGKFNEHMEAYECLVNAVPEPIILPNIFNDDNNVDAPETI
jgi:hypothetical protein